LQQAQADLQLAQQIWIRQRQIAAADIEQTRTELEVAQEQYDRDRDLVRAGARQSPDARISAHLAEAAQLAKATSRREVLEAEAQPKRAQSDVEVSVRIRLSSATIRRGWLNQAVLMLRTSYSICPISGRVADREVNPWSVIYMAS